MSNSDSTSRALAIQQERQKLITQKLFSPKYVQLVTDMYPGKCDAKTFLKICQQSVFRNPLLLSCDPTSILVGTVQIAQTGLEIDGYHAHLVPFWSKGGYLAQPIIDNKGYISLVRQNGHVVRVDLEAVHESDFFEYELGTDPYIKHKFGADREFNSAEDVLYAYSIVQYANGVKEFKIVTRADILKARSSSSSFKRKGEGPWKDHPAEMAKKTAFLRHRKTMDIRGHLSMSVIKGMEKVEQSDYMDIESYVVGEAGEYGISEDIDSQTSKPAPVKSSDVLRKAASLSKAAPNKEVDNESTYDIGDDIQDPFANARVSPPEESEQQAAEEYLPGVDPDVPNLIISLNKLISADNKNKAKVLQACKEKGYLVRDTENPVLEDVDPKRLRSLIKNWSVLKDQF